MLRLVEMVPEKTFEPDGAFRITFIDRAKNIETRIIPTKKEALELYNLWLEGKEITEQNQ
jgi:hypothetical protein